MRQQCRNGFAVNVLKKDDGRKHLFVDGREDIEDCGEASGRIWKGGGERPGYDSEVGGVERWWIVEVGGAAGPFYGAIGLESVRKQNACGFVGKAGWRLGDDLLDDLVDDWDGRADRNDRCWGGTTENGGGGRREDNGACCWRNRSRDDVCSR